MSKKMIKKSELDEAIKKDPAMTNKPYFRWFAYLFFAIILSFGVAVLTLNLIAPTIMFLTPVVIGFLIELVFYFGRKKHGLDYISGYDKNIERLKREGRLIDDTVDGGNDKKDLDYWFGLFEKGAISEEEYEVKKKELLNK